MIGIHLGMPAIPSNHSRDTRSALYRHGLESLRVHIIKSRRISEGMYVCVYDGGGGEEAPLPDEK